MTRGFYGCFAVIAAVLVAQGCTTRAWYNGLQHSARQACLSQPSSEQARCEARLYQQDFEHYEKQSTKNINKINE